MPHSADDKILDRAALKHAAASGMAVSLGSQMAKFGAQLVYQIVLARLLSPSDFGLVAMTAPILAFIQLFLELGLSQVTVQRAQISPGQLSFLFWVNVYASVFLGLLTIAISPLVGAFYSEPRAATITTVSASLFILSGLSSQHLAVMNRNMAFGKLALIDLGSFLMGAVLGIVSASNGLGYWSIIIAQGATSLATCILSWVLSGWRPGKIEGGNHWRNLLAFGGNLTGFNIVNYLARNLDNVLIGRFNGRDALGLYDRAYKLMLMPLSQISQPLSRVAMPLLARTINEPDLYRKAYVRTLELVLILTYPFALFAILTHKELIRIVLGERWAGVAPIFAILGVGALFAPVANSTGWLFISQNRTRHMRNYGAFSSALFIGSFIAGLPWGPIGVASCYIAVGIAQWPILLWAATRTGPVTRYDVLGALTPHALPIVVCCAVEVLLQQALPSGVIRLLLLFLVAYISYITTMLIVPRSRGILKEVWLHGRLSLMRLRLSL